jgi:hypothetical protein
MPSWFFCFRKSGGRISIDALAAGIGKTSISFDDSVMELKGEYG